MEEEFKAGTKFIVSGHKELEKKGWILGLSKTNSRVYQTEYTHEDYNGVITWDMIEKYQGIALTVKDLAIWNSLKAKEKDKWYTVEENKHQWPVSVFTKTKTMPATMPAHHCEQGMTPIYGWVICKHCGVNLFTCG